MAKRIVFKHVEMGEGKQYPDIVLRDRSIFLQWAKMQIEPTDRYKQKYAAAKDTNEIRRLEKYERPYDTAETAVRMVEKNNGIQPYTYTEYDFVETANWLGYFYGE